MKLLLVKGSVKAPERMSDVAEPTTRPGRTGAGALLLAVAVVLVAFNLCPAISPAARCRSWSR
ncbi:hypothetical protein GCM10023320_78380 [Pseudonocardia adelaidensis]|uniref:Uncharacterized protein n=1 Tax=Pseudonocardia adelaidensis TaxID=648754 RepID=A0ABP9P4P0_9PSEU